MSSIIISDDKPGTMPVEAGWVEQLANDAQVLDEMIFCLTAAESGSDYSKFILLIRDRMNELANQLEQIVDEGGVRG